MKIGLFGEDIFSAQALKSLIDYGHSILVVVCPFRENNNDYNSLKLIADKHDILFLRELDINSEKIRKKIKELKIELIVSVHLKKILKEELFSIPKYGAINVHPSLLPKYKGLSPQHQALLHGDSKTAVTIHFIEKGIDTGDIIIQEIIPIEDTDYISDLQFKILQVYKTIFIKAINLLQDKNFKSIKQSEEGSSYFGKIKFDDRVIKFNNSKKQVYNQIRALSLPYKGALCEGFVIWESNFISEEKERILMKKYSHPQVVLDKVKDILYIVLSDGILISDDFEYINNENS